MHVYADPEPPATPSSERRSSASSVSRTNRIFLGLFRMDRLLSSKVRGRDRAARYERRFTTSVFKVRQIRDRVNALEAIAYATNSMRRAPGQPHEDGALPARVARPGSLPGAGRAALCYNSGLGWSRPPQTPASFRSFPASTDCRVLLPCGGRKRDR